MRIAIIGCCFLIAAASPLVALAVDFDDVLRMLDAGVSEESILRLIEEDDAVFVLDAEDLIDLKDAGATDAFIDEMLDRSVGEDSRASGDRYGDYYGHSGYSAYVSINYVYDPFDYYFVSWPFYYGYVAPFRFSRAWWYYGGPYHWHWCDSWGYRTHYYNDRWGVRSVWDRGYRGQTHYHVPRYESREKTASRMVYDRPALAGSKGNADKTRRTWNREGRLEGRDEKRVRGGRESRDSSRPSWGREDRKSNADRNAQTRRPEIRERSKPQAPPARVAPSHPNRNPGKQTTPAPAAPRPNPRQSPSRPSR